MKETLQEIFKDKVYVIEVPNYSKQYADGCIKGYLTNNRKSYAIWLEPLEYNLHSLESAGLQLNMFEQDDKTRSS